MSGSNPMDTLDKLASENQTLLMPSSLPGAASPEELFRYSKTLPIGVTGNRAIDPEYLATLPFGHTQPQMWTDIRKAEESAIVAYLGSLPDGDKRLDDWDRAKAYQPHFGVDPKQIFENLEQYDIAFFGSKTFPKTPIKAIVDSGHAGALAVAVGKKYSRINGWDMPSRMGAKASEEEIAKLREDIARYEARAVNLQTDITPRDWFTGFMKMFAGAAPYITKVAVEGAAISLAIAAAAKTMGVLAPGIGATAAAGLKSTAASLGFMSKIRAAAAIPAGGMAGQIALQYSFSAGLKAAIISTHTFLEGQDILSGMLYKEMIEMGIPHETAVNIAPVGGAVSSALETVFGIGSYVAGGAAKVMQVGAIKKATEAISNRLHASGAIAPVTKFLLELLGEGASEAFDEGGQAIVEGLSIMFAQAIIEEGLVSDPLNAHGLARNAAEEFVWGGLIGGAYGLPFSIIGGVRDRKLFNKVASRAQHTDPSSFIELVKGAGIFDGLGMSDQQIADAARRIHETQTSSMMEALKGASDAARGIGAQGAGDVKIVDTGGNEVPVNRTEDGSLLLERTVKWADDRHQTVEFDFGDAKDGKGFGLLDVKVDHEGRTVEIVDATIDAVYSPLAQEMIQSVGNSYPGYAVMLGNQVKSDDVLVGAFNSLSEKSSTFLDGNKEAPILVSNKLTPDQAHTLDVLKKRLKADGFDPRAAEVMSHFVVTLRGIQLDALNKLADRDANVKGGGIDPVQAMTGEDTIMIGDVIGGNRGSQQPFITRTASGAILSFESVIKISKALAADGKIETLQHELEHSFFRWFEDFNPTYEPFKDLLKALGKTDDQIDAHKPGDMLLSASDNEILVRWMNEWMAGKIDAIPTQARNIFQRLGEFLKDFFRYIHQYITPEASAAFDKMFKGVESLAPLVMMNDLQSGDQEYFPHPHAWKKDYDKAAKRHKARGLAEMAIRSMSYSPSKIRKRYENIAAEYANKVTDRAKKKLLKKGAWEQNIQIVAELKQYNGDPLTATELAVLVYARLATPDYSGPVHYTLNRIIADPPNADRDNYGKDTIEKTILMDLGDDVKVEGRPLGDDFWVYKSKTVLDKKLRQPAKGPEILKMLVGNGVKAEEMKWTGLDKFLSEDRTFSKDEVIAYIDSHKLNLVEVVKKADQASRNERYEFYDDDGERLSNPGEFWNTPFVVPITVDGTAYNTPLEMELKREALSKDKDRIAAEHEKLSKLAVSDSEMAEVKESMSKLVRQYQKNADLMAQLAHRIENQKALDRDTYTTAQHPDRYGFPIGSMGIGWGRFWTQEFDKPIEMEGLTFSNAYQLNKTMEMLQDQLHGTTDKIQDLQTSKERSVRTLRQVHKDANDKPNLSYGKTIEALEKDIAEYDRRIDALRKDNSEAVDFQSLVGKKLQELMEADRKIDHPAPAKFYPGIDFDPYNTYGGTNRREIVIMAPDLPGEFVGHWHEVNKDAQLQGVEPGPVIGHIRTQDFRTPDGKRVLHVEEFQTDLHKEGQQYGYKNKNSAEHKKAMGEHRDLIADAKKYYDEHYDSDVYIGRAPGGLNRGEAITYVNMVNPALAKSLEHALDVVQSTAPDAPFKSSFTDLAFKRIYAQAVAEGYDYVAWTDSSEQLARWPIEPTITEVSYKVRGDGSVYVSYKDSNGSQPNVLFNKDSTDITRTLGETVANKLYELMNDEKVIAAAKEREDLLARLHDAQSAVEKLHDEKRYSMSESLDDLAKRQALIASSKQAETLQAIQEELMQKGFRSQDLYGFPHDLHGLYISKSDRAAGMIEVDETSKVSKKGDTFRRIYDKEVPKIASKIAKEHGTEVIQNLEVEGMRGHDDNELSPSAMPIVESMQEIFRTGLELFNKESLTVSDMRQVLAEAMNSQQPNAKGTIEKTNLIADPEQYSQAGISEFEDQLIAEASDFANAQEWAEFTGYEWDLLDKQSQDWMTEMHRISTDKDFKRMFEKRGDFVAYLKRDDNAVKFIKDLAFAINSTTDVENGRYLENAISKTPAIANLVKAYEQKKEIPTDNQIGKMLKEISLSEPLYKLLYARMTGNTDLGWEAMQDMRQVPVIKRQSVAGSFNGVIADQQKILNAFTDHPYYEKLKDKSLTMKEIEELASKLHEEHKSRYAKHSGSPSTVVYNNQTLAAYKLEQWRKEAVKFILDKNMADMDAMYASRIILLQQALESGRPVDVTTMRQITSIFFQTGGPQSEANMKWAEAVQEMMETIYSKPMDEWTIGDMQAVVDYMKMLRKQAKDSMRNRQLIFGHMAKTDGTIIYKEVEALNEKHKYSSPGTKQNEKLKRNISAFDAANAQPAPFYKKYLGKKAADLLFSEEVMARRHKYENIDRRKAPVLDFMAKKENKDIMKLLKQDVFIEGIGGKNKITDENGTDWNITIAQLMGLRALVGRKGGGFNQKQRDAAIYGLFYSEDEKAVRNESGIGNPNQIDKYMANLYEDKVTRLLDAIDKYIPVDSKLEQLVQIMMKSIDNDQDWMRFASAVYEMSNKEIKKEPFYWTMLREGTFVEGEDEIMDRMKQNGVHKGIDQSISLDRKNIKPHQQKPMQYDIMKVYFDTLNKQEHLINMGLYAKHLHGVFNHLVWSTALNGKIKNIYGRAMLDHIKNHIDEVTNPIDFQKKEDGGEAIYGLRGAMVFSTIGFRASNVVMQLLTSPLPGLSEAPIELMEETLKSLANPVKYVRDIEAKSAHLRHRQISVEEAILRDRVEKGVATKLESYMEVGLRGMSYADRYSVAMVWEAVRRSREKAGFDTESAIQEADEFILRTQPSSDGIYRSPMYRNMTGFKALALQFTNPLNVIYNNLRYDVPDAIREHHYMKAAMIVTAYGLSGLAMGLVYCLRGYGPDDDADEEAKTRWWLHAFTQQYTDAIPFVGSWVTDATRGMITGEPVRIVNFNEQYPAAAAFRKAVAQFVNMSNNGQWDPDSIKRLALATIEGPARLTGMPIGGYKELKGFWDRYTGE